MAFIQTLIEDVHRQFGHFASKGNGTEATTKDITRWAKDAGLFKGAKSCTTQNMDIAFSKVKTKGQFAIVFDQFLVLLHEICPQFAQDHGITTDEAEIRLLKLFAFSDKMVHGTTGVSKTGNVEKMTDVTQYTGMHKAKFEALEKGTANKEHLPTGHEWQWKTDENPHIPSGPTYGGGASPGSSLSGAHPVPDHSGYVASYKGAGTYDKIHPPPAPFTGPPAHTGPNPPAHRASSATRKESKELKMLSNDGKVGAIPVGHRASADAGGSKSTAQDVTARLTDTTGYTGMHKERFDSSGHGKGIAGRAYHVDGKGYTGNYKNDTRTGL